MRTPTARSAVRNGAPNFPTARKIPPSPPRVLRGRRSGRTTSPGAGRVRAVQAYSVIVGADIDVYGTVRAEYLTGGEGIVAKRKGQPIVKTVCVSGEAETDDEFSTDYIGDILLHSENVHIARVDAEAGQVCVQAKWR